jgi:hypothetical protein
MPQKLLKCFYNSDGYKSYLEAFDNAFHLDINYAMLVKLYGAPEGETQTERKYSSHKCTGARKHIISGLFKMKHVSTSFAEWQIKH